MMWIARDEEEFLSPQEQEQMARSLEETRALLEECRQELAGLQGQDLWQEEARATYAQLVRSLETMLTLGEQDLKRAREISVL